MGKPAHDWYAKEWLKHLGKKQADVVRELDWNKAKISLTASGKQPYSRDDVNELAAWLHLEPFELLLPPERAMAIRRLRASAENIVASVPAPEDTPPSLLDARYDRLHGSPAKRRKRNNG